MPLLPGDDFQTSFGLQSDPGKYCFVVNYVVLEAIKIKFKPTPLDPLLFFSFESRVIL